jgi:hypothetical protein
MPGGIDDGGRSGKGGVRSRFSAVVIHYQKSRKIFLTSCSHNAYCKQGMITMRHFVKACACSILLLGAVTTAKAQTYKDPTPPPIKVFIFSLVPGLIF